MRRYLFDTGALSVILAGTIPDKWSRPWEEVKHGKGRLILLEQIIFGPHTQFGFHDLLDTAP